MHDILTNVYSIPTNRVYGTARGKANSLAANGPRGDPRGTKAAAVRLDRP